MGLETDRYLDLGAYLSQIIFYVIRSHATKGVAQVDDVVTGLGELFRALRDFRSRRAVSPLQHRDGFLFGFLDPGKDALRVGDFIQVQAYPSQIAVFRDFIPLAETVGIGAQKDAVFEFWSGSSCAFQKLFIAQQGRIAGFFRAHSASMA